MILKERIDIQDDKLTRGIGPVVKIMNLIEGSSDEEIIVDCSSIRFVSPVFIISFILCLYSSKKRLRVINKTPYLDIIHFLDTLKPDKFSKAEFCTLLRKYESKTYIPVINFPALANRSSDKDAILSAIENILCLQLGIKHNVLNGLKYILGEMVDNITEHSESERGYIFAQSYPKKGYIDLCIADEGITLNGSFNKAGIEVGNDIEAMQAANKGVSSKNLPDVENRGYGIYTSKKMLITGLKGQYMMMSGSAIYLKAEGFDNIIELPEGLRWNGTIIALRIPYQNEYFLYTRYFE